MLKKVIFIVMVISCLLCYPNTHTCFCHHPATATAKMAELNSTTTANQYEIQAEEAEEAEEEVAPHKNNKFKAVLIWLLRAIMAIFIL